MAKLSPPANKAVPAQARTTKATPSQKVAKSANQRIQTPTAKAPTPAQTTKAKATATPTLTSATPTSTATPSTTPLVKVKTEKVKMQRDSFTMPKDEYAQIAALKKRLEGLQRAVKKSELLRAGLKLLTQSNDAALFAALEAIPVIKTGRPHKKH